MKPAALFVIKFIIGMLLLLLLMIGVALFLMNRASSDNYKNLIQQRFATTTGHELKFNGPLNIKLAPLPKGEIKDIGFKFYLPNGTLDVFAKDLNFDIGFSTLYSDQVNIKNIAGKNITFTLHDNSGKTSKYFIKEFTGSTLVDCCKASIPNFSLKTEFGDIKGQLTLIKGNNTILVEGNLTSDKIYLPLILKTPLSKDLIGFKWLAKLRGNVDLTIKEWVINPITLSDAQLKINFNQKSTFSLQKANVGKGNALGQLTINNIKEVPELALQFSLANGEAISIIDLADYKPIKNGTIDTEIKLTTRGDDLNAIIKGLTGHVTWKLSDLQLEKTSKNPATSFANKIVSNLLQQNNGISIECAVINYPIVQGVAKGSNNIALQSSSGEGIGGGDVHFDTQKLNLLLNLTNQQLQIKGNLNDPIINNINQSTKNVTKDSACKAVLNHDE